MPTNPKKNRTPLLAALAPAALLTVLAFAGCTADAPRASTEQEGCVLSLADLGCHLSQADCLRPDLDAGKDGACDRNFARPCKILQDLNGNGICDEALRCLLREHRATAGCEIPADACGALDAVLPGDFDGDGLADHVEEALKTLGKRGDLCSPDVDGDGIPDGRDLVWQDPDDMTGADPAFLDNRGQNGIAVDAWITSFYQVNDHWTDSPDCGRHVDGPYMDDPWGDGEPVIASGSFIGTGALSPGPSGGGRVAFEHFTYDDHFTDDECRTGLHSPLVAPIALPEDVTAWLQAPSSGLFPAFEVPTIAGAFLMLDHDGGCTGHDLYGGMDSHEYDICSGPIPMPDVGLGGVISFALPLVDATGVVRETVGQVSDSAGAVPEKCVAIPGIVLCFQVKVTDFQGRPIDWCVASLVALVWELGAVAGEVADVQSGFPARFC